MEEAEDEPISQPEKSELEEGNESASAASNTSNNNLRLRAPLSPRTGDNIRVRMKFRHRHSSGSDDSINLSQTGISNIFIYFILNIKVGESGGH